MRHILAAALGIAVTAAGSAMSTDAASGRQAATSVLPDSPCDLLSIEEVSRAAGIAVQSMERKPSIRKEVEAQRENREPDPGTICSYEAADFGAITVVVPARATRSAAAYWRERAWYFNTYQGSARPVRELGEDAWLAGETSLRVLIHDSDYFSVSTQQYTPASPRIAIRVARAVLAHF